MLPPKPVSRMRLSHVLPTTIHHVKAETPGRVQATVMRANWVCGNRQGVAWRPGVLHVIGVLVPDLGTAISARAVMPGIDAGNLIWLTL